MYVIVIYRDGERNGVVRLTEGENYVFTLKL